MFINNRVILKDNTVFTDLSGLLSDPHAGPKALAIVAAQDALYVGSDMPFNNRFFMVQTKNAIAGTVAVAIWDGDSFVACEDLQDMTSVEGVPFARSGLIRWDLPDDTGWAKVADSTEITDLASAGFKSKAQYWAKITFSAAFVFELQYVGFRFARDADLKTYHRDLLSPDIMKAFNGGAPMQDWDTVHIQAAEEIIQWLRRKEIIVSPNQMLDPEAFTAAAAHKLAEMAWSTLRNEERMEFARDKFKEAISMVVYPVDQSGNGRLSSAEKTESGRLRRV